MLFSIFADKLWLDSMRYLGNIISTVALLTSAACVSSHNVSQSLSIDQLLAHPSKFDETAVVVVAYANIEFEVDVLCDVPIPPRKCIWLTYNEEPYETEQDLARYDAVEEKWRAFHEKRVIVRGTFKLWGDERFRLYPGEINRITGVKLAP